MSRSAWTDNRKVHGICERARWHTARRVTIDIERTRAVGVELWPAIRSVRIAGVNDSTWLHADEHSARSYVCKRPDALRRRYRPVSQRYCNPLLLCVRVESESDGCDT